tara:strand:+ start:4745 stop:5059 length:315 start_codon:yes stop_codon:yes gene_type:complete
MSEKSNVTFNDVPMVLEQLLKALNKVDEQLLSLSQNNGLNQSEQLISREQTAELLNVNLSTLWAWTKKGKLLSYGIGNKVFYKRSEIENSLIPLNNNKGLKNGK